MWGTTSKRKEQRDGEYHRQAHYELQGETHLYIINGLITSGRHNQGIGRGREGRGKTHAGGYGHAHEQRHCAYACTRGRRKGYGSHQHGCHRIANEKGEEGCGGIDGGHEQIGAMSCYSFHQSLREGSRYARFLQSG